MKNDVIFRGLCGIGIALFSIETGKSLCIRKLCYNAEKFGAGTIKYTDIHGTTHQAVVRPLK